MFDKIVCDFFLFILRNFYLVLETLMTELFVLDFISLKIFF